jgi:hypothetical protein
MAKCKCGFTNTAPPPCPYCAAPPERAAPTEPDVRDTLKLDDDAFLLALSDRLRNGGGLSALAAGLLGTRLHLIASGRAPVAPSEAGAATLFDAAYEAARLSALGFGYRMGPFALQNIVHAALTAAGVPPSARAPSAASTGEGTRDG